MSSIISVTAVINWIIWITNERIFRIVNHDKWKVSFQYIQRNRGHQQRITRARNCRGLTFLTSFFFLEKKINFPAAEYFNLQIKFSHLPILIPVPYKMCSQWPKFSDRFAQVWVRYISNSLSYQIISKLCVWSEYFNL